MAEQTFTSGQILTAAQMTTLQTNTGLAYITKLAFTAATAASPATIDGCFTATYNAYRIVVQSKYSVASDTNLRFRLRSAGSTPSQTVWTQYTAYNTPAGAGLVYLANQSLGTIANSADTNATCSADIQDPFTARATCITSQSMALSTTTSIFSNIGCGLNNTTSYDGFQIYTDAGNITGTVYVYGYRI
jgi:hypothetical protein